jgi:hypothetical protein
MNHFKLTKTAWVLLVLVILFIFTRYAAFERGFASEETLMIMPGKFLAEGKPFVVYFGESCPPLPSLGHPPLTYIVAGLLSHWGSDVTAARLLPFIIGLGAFLAPYILTGSIVSSLVVLLSPFFYSAANHVQTDPTFGLLGFTLLAAYMYLYFKDLPYSHSKPKLFGLLILSFCILFMTKTVIAAMAVCAVGCAIVLVPKEFRMTYFLRFVAASIIGALSYMIVVLLISLNSDLTFVKALKAPFQLIQGLVGSKLENNSINPQAAWDDRYTIVRLLLQQKAVELFGILIVSSAIALGFNWNKFSWRVVGALLITSLVPIAVYFYVGYPGDGYPRYFLIAFPSLFILLGYSLKLFESRHIRLLCSSLIILACVLLMGDRLWRMINEKGSVTVMAGRELLSREAYTLAHQLTKPGDLILGFDQGILYLPERKMLVAQAFYTYPDQYPHVEAIAEDLKAAVIPQATLESTEFRDQFLMKLVNKLVTKGAARYPMGHFYIYALPQDSGSP